MFIATNNLHVACYSKTPYAEDTCFLNTMFETALLFVSSVIMVLLKIQLITCTLIPYVMK